MSRLVSPLFASVQWVHMGLIIRIVDTFRLMSGSPNPWRSGKKISSWQEEMDHFTLSEEGHLPKRRPAVWFFPIQ